MSSTVQYERKESGYAGLIGLIAVVAIILIMASLFLGTGKDESDVHEGPGVRNEQDSAQVNPGLSKPSSPVQAVSAAKLKLRLTSLTKSIQTFEALEGRKPASLDELKETQGCGFQSLPEGYLYSYDPSTGRAVIKKKDGEIVCK